MPFGNGISSFDPHHDDDATFILNNPSAGRSETSFTSAVRSKDTRPAVRRRGSEGTAGRVRTDHDPWHDSHTRSRTLEGDSGSHHPLVRNSIPGSKSPDGVSGHDTRPGLKRLLSDSEPLSVDSQEELVDTRTMGSPPQREERIVLVHEVSNVT